MHFDNLKLLATQAFSYMHRVYFSLYSYMYVSTTPQSSVICTYICKCTLPQPHTWVQLHNQWHRKMFGPYFLTTVTALLPQTAKKEKHLGLPYRELRSLLAKDYLCSINSSEQLADAQHRTVMPQVVPPKGGPPPDRP